jgi:hypothetical protein
MTRSPRHAEIPITEEIITNQVFDALSLVRPTLNILAL